MLTATVHNAKRCTVDGRDCFVACICDQWFKFLYRGDCISEHVTEAEAIDWCKRELQRRGETEIEICVRRRCHNGRHVDVPLDDIEGRSAEYQRFLYDME